MPAKKRRARSRKPKTANQDPWPVELQELADGRLVTVMSMDEIAPTPERLAQAIHEYQTMQERWDAGLWGLRDAPRCARERFRNESESERETFLYMNTPFPVNTRAKLAFYLDLQSEARYGVHREGSERKNLRGAYQEAKRWANDSGLALPTAAEAPDFESLRAWAKASATGRKARTGLSVDDAIRKAKIPPAKIGAAKRMLYRRAREAQTKGNADVWLETGKLTLTWPFARAVLKVYKPARG